MQHAFGIGVSMHDSMAHFGQVWIYYAVVGGGMGTSSECASFFVLNVTEKGISAWQSLLQSARIAT